MKHYFVVLFFCFFSVSAAFADTTEDTHSKVDSLKESISYPKYNIGDTLYIAFIKDPDVDCRYLKESDIIVYKVIITGLMLYNSYEGPDSSAGLYINPLAMQMPTIWGYQYVDASIANPKYGDWSSFFDEDRFHLSPEDAIDHMLKSNQ